MYKIVAFISLCIRLLLLPNLASGLPGLWPFFIDAIVHGYTFSLVSIFSQGKLGSTSMSIFYLIFYIVNAYSFVWAKVTWGSFAVILPCSIYILFLFVIIIFSSQFIEQL